MNRVKIKSFGIQFKLIVAFLLPVICIIILGIVSYRRTTKAVEEQYQKSTMQTIGKAADYLNLLMLNVEDTSLNITSDKTILSYYGNSAEEGTDLSVVLKKLKSYLVVDDYIQYGYFIAANGEHISTNSKIKFDSSTYDNYLASKDYAEIAARSNKVWLGYSEFLSGLVYGGERKTILTLTRQMKDSNTGNTLGYLILEVRPEVITDILTDLDFGTNSIVVLVGQDLNEITLEENLSDKPEEAIISGTEVYNDILQDVEIEGYKYMSLNRSKHLLCYSYIGNLGCVLTGMIPEATMREQTDDIKLLTIILVFIASFLAIGVGTVMASSMSSNIKKIIKSANQAAKGDLTHRVKSRRKDEFLDLSNSINDMIDNVKYLIGNVQTVYHQMESGVHTVSDTSHDVNRIAKDIGTSIEQIECGVEQQSENTTTCLATMDQLSNKITIVSDNIEGIDAISNGTKQLVKDGIASMEILNRKSVETADLIHDIITEVGRLGDKIKNINNIIDVITEIGDQTNLLALNASIEAARAGEAGKGFAVVAKEVNNLSARSIKSAKEIGSIVAEIQAQTNKTVGRVSSADEILHAEELALEDVVKAFEDINHQVTELNVNIDNIAAGTKIIEQSKVQTLDAMQGITAAAQQTSASAVEMSTAVENQISEMDKLAKFSDDLKLYSNQLQGELSKFVIE